jgi:hypothetical protein
MWLNQEAGEEEGRGGRGSRRGGTSWFSFRLLLLDRPLIVAEGEELWLVVSLSSSLSQSFSPLEISLSFHLSSALSSSKRKQNRCIRFFWFIVAFRRRSLTGGHCSAVH